MVSGGVRGAQAGISMWTRTGSGCAYLCDPAPVQQIFQYLGLGGLPSRWPRFAAQSRNPQDREGLWNPFVFERFSFSRAPSSRSGSKWLGRGSFAKESGDSPLRTRVEIVWFAPRQPEPCAKSSTAPRNSQRRFRDQTLSEREGNAPDGWDNFCCLRWASR